MDFEVNRLPSLMKETEWYWQRTVQDNFSLENIILNDETIDFTFPADYFDMHGYTADAISRTGASYNIFSQNIYLKEFGLNIYGNIEPDSEIGVLLNSIKRYRPEADTYGLFVRYKYIENSVYCGVTICFVDKDFADEMATAVFEIGEDEHSYVLPVAINEVALDYYSFDDLAKLAYWLGDFWAGIQYKLNNCPNEIRVVDQRELTTYSQDEVYNKGDTVENRNRIVLVEHVIPVDENGNEIKYGNSNSKRQYRMPAWGVRGHDRHLKDGRVIPVRPYPKGKERNNPDAIVMGRKK